LKYETLNGVQLPKIGFGTWKIGGQSTPDHSLDEISRKALISALEIGFTHFDTAEYYAHGHAEELLGEVIRETNIPRKNLFITSKVLPAHLDFKNVIKSCENSLNRLRMEYLDLYLIHSPNLLIPLKETFSALNQLVRQGKVRHLGVSNFKLKQLEQASDLSEIPLLTDQVPYSLPEKTYVKNGVLEFCRKKQLFLTAYSPVKFRNLNVNPLLKKIAEAHTASPAQIALAWLISQPNVITIPFSSNPIHQKENFDAAEIELSEAELQHLNQLYLR
jgi:diketogulonate reductase-like aldo/keto reductase